MKAALSFFENALAKNRLAHLYLIVGPKGAGKMALVEKVSHMILKQENHDPDHLMRMIEARTAPNMMVIEPEGMNVKKEQITALQNEFSKTALVAGPRIYCINHAERLNQASANTLLKFMEEPQSASVFGFLLAESRDAVIPTIMSRSQVITLTGTDEKDMTAQLIEQGLDRRLAEIAPFLTKNIDDARLLIEDQRLTDVLDVLEEMVDHWTDKDVSLMIDICPKLRFLAADRPLFMTFTEILMLYFLDLIHYKANQEIAFGYFKESIMTNSDHMTTGDINAVIDVIQEALHRQSYNINLDLALDHLLYTLEKKR